MLFTCATHFHLRLPVNCKILKDMHLFKGTLNKLPFYLLCVVVNYFEQSKLSIKEYINNSSNSRHLDGAQYILYTFLVYINTYNHHKTKSLVLLLSPFYRQKHSRTQRPCQSSHSYYMGEPVFKSRFP